MAKGSAKEYDKALGQRLKKHRLLAGVSQEKLGEALGLTFQQVQKYEKGTNRLAIGYLPTICEKLHCSVSDLMGDDVPANAEGAMISAFMSTRQGVQLAQAFTSLPDDLDLRNTVIRMIELMGGRRG